MRWAGALGAIVLLSGCADFGGPISGTAPVPPQEARLQALEERLGELTRKVENLDFVARTQETQRLEAELRGLRGDVERLRYDIDSGEQRSRQLYQDLDRRIQLLENEGRAARLTLEPRLSSAPPVPGSAQEEATYLGVFEKLKASRYDEAIAGFKSQLETWPEGQYADNAWYWMGESHLVKREHEAAAKAFRALLERFPDSPKAPDARLKLGDALKELGDAAGAKAQWQRVVDEHAKSSAAEPARKRLERAAR